MRAFLSMRKRISEEVAEAEEKLRAALSEEQIDLLENYQDARNVVVTLDLQENFVAGFGLSARILVEALRVDIPHLPEL